MFNEILYYINPLNWDINGIFVSLSSALAPELLLLFILVFATFLTRVIDFKGRSLLPYLLSSGVVALFFILRFIGVGNIFVFVMPVIYFIFIAVRQMVRGLEYKMYDFKSETKMHNVDSAPPPIVAQIVIIFFDSLGITLSVLPLFYIFQAFEQFETMPNLITILIGCFFMIYATLSLLACSRQVKERVDKDKEEEKRRGYISDGRFKRSQSPVQYYELIFWTGVFLSGLIFYIGIGQWFFALIGYLMIGQIMKKQAADHEKTRRAFLKQNKDYDKYHRTTPIIYPFWPAHTLLKETDTAVITKTVSAHDKGKPDTEGEQGEGDTDDKKGKKKRPPKSERPKKEPKAVKEKKEKPTRPPKAEKGK